jgi:predicted GIY-YIG superfamily endonuclease
MTKCYMFLKQDWCGLRWSEWIPFENGVSRVPSSSGLYRVKPRANTKLIYIGQTSNLKQRVRVLISEIKKPVMPFRDPHNGAPCLWVWQKEEGYTYEYSFSEVENNNVLRKAYEHYLFWKYRLEYGESPNCSFGKFHRSYVISSNSSRGIHGCRLENQTNNAGLDSHKPLQLCGRYSDENWMGLNWIEPLKLEYDEVTDLENKPAVYKIFTGQELLYIGETNELKCRMKDHLDKTWQTLEVYFSYSIQDTNILPHQLKEIENDLIAACFEQEKRVPLFQFQNHR